MTAVSSKWKIFSRFQPLKIFDKHGESGWVLVIDFFISKTSSTFFNFSNSSVLASLHTKSLSAVPKYKVVCCKTCKMILKFCSHFAWRSWYVLIQKHLKEPIYPLWNSFPWIFLVLVDYSFMVYIMNTLYQTKTTSVHDFLSCQMWLPAFPGILQTLCILKSNHWASKFVISEQASLKAYVASLPSISKVNALFSRIFGLQQSKRLIHWKAALDQVLSSHSIVSSSRTVKPCAPCVGRCTGKWRTTWLTGCSSVLSRNPHKGPYLICVSRSWNVQRLCGGG